MSPRRVLLVGPKHSGKSTVGSMLAERLQFRFEDLDDEIVRLYSHPKVTSARGVYRSVGRVGFQELELAAASGLAEATIDRGLVIASGGGIIENSPAFGVLSVVSVVIYLDVPLELLVERVFRHGVPAFVDRDRPEEHFREIYLRRHSLYQTGSDIRVDVGERSPYEVVRIIQGQLEEKGFERQ
jgi:shikimate kinase